MVASAHRKHDSAQNAQRSQAFLPPFAERGELRWVNPGGAVVDVEVPISCNPMVDRPRSSHFNGKAVKVEEERLGRRLWQGVRVRDAGQLPLRLLQVNATPSHRVVCSDDS